MVTRISFLMPTFNRAHLIAESIDAVLAQMSADDELLVVDDGSTDNTPDVVGAYGPPVRYVRQPNSGKSAALNRAMALTDGQFVWICDDDDLLRPNAVNRLVHALATSSAGFVFGKYTRFSDEAGIREELGTGYWPDLQQGSLLRHILEDAFVMQNAALVRRECYDVVGPFSEAMPRSLDYEMFVRLAACFPCDYVDALIFDQRKHDGARGPASMLHAAERSDQIWSEYDSLIFRKLRESMPLSLYENMFIATDPQLLRRAALLQRACVQARHGCWAEALTDLSAAADVAPSLPLDPGEAAICHRVLRGKHGLAKAMAPDVIGGMRALGRTGIYASALVREIMAGTIWRLRRGTAEERSQAWAILRRVLGLAGAALTIARHTTPRRGPSTVYVHERRTVAARALLHLPLEPVGLKDRAA